MKSSQNTNKQKVPLKGGFRGAWLLVIRNLLGNGLKTWLNVFILSISFVMIVFMQGILQGWDREAISDTKKWEIAGGQYWNAKYDPYDPFTLDSASNVLPQAFDNAYKNGKIEPVLISMGTIYPQNRSVSLMIKGINPNQKLLQLPTQKLVSADSTNIPAIIGLGMANQTGLKEGDVVTLRWRDANGTFEAQDIRIASVFKTFVPSVDNGQIWLPLETMQKMTLKPNSATILLKSEKAEIKNIDGWNFKSIDDLTKPLKETLKSKKFSQSIFYSIFLLLGLLAIFDTQTLAIFRRQKEIGTFVALGLTQKEVVRLFTLEGTMNAILAIVVGAVYGVPMFIYFSTKGIPMPSGSSSFGIAIADKIYPAFPPQLIIGTIALIVVLTAFVSYLPAKKISKMNPTDAIRGKIQ